jgi:hypothetical protein
MLFRSLLAAAVLGAPSAALAVTFDFSAELATVTDLGGGEFTFTQAGFSDGAEVTGAFSGTDVDGNGQLSWFAGEVTAFVMSFSGNSLVDAFSLDFSNLFGLVFDLDGDIGDGLDLDIEGIGAASGTHFYAVGPGPFAFCDGIEDCGVVAQVPEPASLGLFGLGLLFVGLGRRKQPTVRRAATACNETP